MTKYFNCRAHNKKSNDNCCSITNHQSTWQILDSLFGVQFARWHRFAQCFRRFGSLGNACILQSFEVLWQLTATHRRIFDPEISNKCILNNSTRYATNNIYPALLHWYEINYQHRHEWTCARRSRPVQFKYLWCIHSIDGTSIMQLITRMAQAH